MSAGENRRPVLERDADDFCAEVRRQVQLVAQRGDKQVAGRHLPGRIVAAHAVHGGIVGAVGLLPRGTEDEVVACYAVDGGDGACIDARVPDAVTVGT